MDSTEFLLTSLGLQGVDLDKIEFDKARLSAKIVVRQQREKSVCPHCEEPLYGVKQWRKRALWGACVGAFMSVKIVFYQLQGACGRCLCLRLAKADFLHPRFKGLSTAFAELTGRWMEETTGEAVSRMTGCASMTLWRLDQWRMKRMKQEMTIPEDLPLRLMSADEVHMRTIKPKKNRLDKSQWHRVFITNLVSYEAGIVVANAKGRDARSLKSCLKQLTEKQRRQIKYLAVDMHDGFIKAAEELCPNARVVVDRFHVAEALNRAFNKVRQQEFEKAKQNQDKFQKEMLMPSKRFILMERAKDLAKKDKTRLEKLRKLNGNINTAMMLVEYFHAILDKKTVKQYQQGLDLWVELVNESALEPLKEFLKTVRKYQGRIETYIESHLTTAVSEGLNNKIKVLKRVGYGYTNTESFMNKILQRAGMLSSKHIQTNSWFWGINYQLA